MKYLQGKMHFVAGTINENIVKDKNYDLFVDLPKCQLNVPFHAKGLFSIVLNN